MATKINDDLCPCGAPATGEVQQMLNAHPAMRMCESCGRRKAQQRGYGWVEDENARAQRIARLEETIRRDLKGRRGGNEQ